MPETDRPLDEAIVALVVRDQFGLNATSVRRFGEGWDNETFAVDHDWLFRFPKRVGEAWRVEREIEMMPVIEKAIEIQVPSFEWIGRPGELFPYPFVGYRRIEGVGADRAPQQLDLSRLAATVGSVLTRLHAISPDLIPAHPDGRWGCESLAEDLVEAAGSVRPHLPPMIAPAAEPFLRGDIAPPHYDGVPRVLHGDICPNHLIIEPMGGQLVGIIDFEAPLGDPVFDFVGLVSLGGFSLAKAVREHYAYRGDDNFEERLRWAARVQHLRWVGQTAQDGITSGHQRSDLTKHQRWVTEAFNEDTPLRARIQPTAVPNEKAR